MEKVHCLAKNGCQGDICMCSRLIFRITPSFILTRHHDVVHSHGMFLVHRYSLVVVLCMKVDNTPFDSQTSEIILHIADKISNNDFILKPFSRQRRGKSWFE